MSTVPSNQPHRIRQAIQEDDAEALRIYMSAEGSSVEYFKEFGEYPLQTAAAGGSLACINVLLGLGGKNSPGAEEALVEAIQERQDEAARWILDAGVDPADFPYEENSDHDVPLTAALATCNATVLDWLCSHGAVQRSDPGWLREALALTSQMKGSAAKQCHLVFGRALARRIAEDPAVDLGSVHLKRFTERFSKLAEGSRELGQCAVILAEHESQNQALEQGVLDILYDPGREVGDAGPLRDFISSQAPSMRPALSSALLPYFVRSLPGEAAWSFVEQLLTWGANINATDDMNGSVVLFLARKKNLELLKRAVAQGAEVNIPREDGRTALDFLKPEREHHRPVYDFLRSVGAKTGRELQGE